MKPSGFRYAVPTSLAAAIAVRAEAEDSVILAGGQSLIPTMNFRLANPQVVIDLSRVPGLDGIEVSGGTVRVGAMARQRAVERDPRVHAANPLIRETLRHVAHPVIRNRGTVCGSLAHADPAAELPALLAATRGSVTAQGPGGRRVIPAAEFFEFIFTTSLEPEEILVAAEFPALEPGEGWAFAEFARRHGDFAVAGVAATLLLGDDGRIRRARLAACGVSHVPVVLTECEELLAGQAPTPDVFAEAGRLAQGAVTVADDSTTTAAYRRHVLAGVVEKTLRTALSRTGERR